MKTEGPKRILIVDDDARNIFALTAVLKAKGYGCLSAQSAADGLKHLDTYGNDIFVVLLDMMMPEMDGYETLRTLRNGPFSDIPVIAVTAQAMTGDRERCLAAGADDYLSKPVDVDRLLALLKNFCQTE